LLPTVLWLPLDFRNTASKDAYTGIRMRCEYASESYEWAEHGLTNFLAYAEHALTKWYAYADHALISKISDSSVSLNLKKYKNFLYLGSVSVPDPHLMVTNKMTWLQMITPRKLTCCTWRPGSPDCSRPQRCRPGRRGTWARPPSHHPGWPAAGSAGYDAAAIPGKEILSQGLGYDTHLQLALWTSKITSSATWRLRQIFLLSRGCSCSARCGSTSWRKISTVKFFMTSS